MAKKAILDQIESGERVWLLSGHPINPMNLLVFGTPPST